MTLVNSTKFNIPVAELTAEHIRSFVDDLVTRDGIETVTIGRVARAFGVAGPVITNRLRVHFSDWLETNYPEHKANVPIDKSRKVLDVAIQIAATGGLQAVTLKALSDKLGVTVQNVATHMESIGALRSKVINEAITQGVHPEIIAAGIVGADPAVAALDVETKRKYWRVAEATLFGS